ncbi:hypothetical protein ACS0TY_016787 [Phlomoides rotata]
MSKPDVSGQPNTYGVKEGGTSLRPQKGPKRVDINNAGVKSCWFFNNTWENLLKGMEFRPEHFITDVSGKYPRLWALKGAGPNDVRRWYNFGALALIRTVAPGFREISELLDWPLVNIKNVYLSPAFFPDSAGPSGLTRSNRVTKAESRSKASHSAGPVASGQVEAAKFLDNSGISLRVTRPSGTDSTRSESFHLTR